MATRLTEAANEGGTYIIPVAFTDEDGSSVVPSSITWTLTDGTGAVINEREDVAVAVPAASIDIVLSGDDLVVTESSDVVPRYLYVKAIYDSDAGTDLPMTGEAIFPLNNLKGVG